MNFRPQTALSPAQATPLVDPFGRAISYLRVSVTDRCDFRCVYCMSEHMQFLPRRDLLTLEELDRLCSAFVARGTQKAAHHRRRAAGAPWRDDAVSSLVAPSRPRRAGRADADDQWLAALAEFAQELADCGVRRVNVSLDTLNPDKFRALTRTGDLARVLSGNRRGAARPGSRSSSTPWRCAASMRMKWSTLTRFAHERGMDMTFIEVMPLGELDGPARVDQYLPLTEVRARLAERFTLDEIDYRTGGPARYMRAAETGGRIGFITPLTHNFCESCNRVRVTCTGHALHVPRPGGRRRSARAAARERRATTCCTRRSRPRSPASRRVMISSSTAPAGTPAVSSAI